MYLKKRSYIQQYFVYSPPLLCEAQGNFFIQKVSKSRDTVSLRRKSSVEYPIPFPFLSRKRSLYRNLKTVNFLSYKMDSIFPGNVLLLRIQPNRKEMWNFYIKISFQYRFMICFYNRFYNALQWTSPTIFRVFFWIK